MMSNSGNADTSARRRAIAKRKKLKRKRLKRAILITIIIALLIIVGVVALDFWLKSKSKGSSEVEKMQGITEAFLTINPYSRPGTSLNSIKGIVIHYTANPGASGINNRNYFESLATSHETSASSHFVIGLEGEIIQCIPTNEVAYASNSRNNDTLAIECCHPDKSGKFTEATYQSLVKLTAYLMDKYNVQIGDVIRHFDVTGKACPKYYVENEDMWEEFKADVVDSLKK